MKKIILMTSTVAMLSACAELAEPTAPPTSAALSATYPKERLGQNTSNTTIRTFIPSAEEGKPPTEVLGAKCTLVSDELTANVTTPQAVILPTFKQRAEFSNRGVPGAISVNCRTPGKSGQALVTANEKKVAVVTGGGIAGLLIGAAVSGAVASSTPWTYPADVRVTLVE